MSRTIPLDEGGEIVIGKRREYENEGTLTFYPQHATMKVAVIGSLTRDDMERLAAALLVTAWEMKE